MEAYSYREKVEAKENTGQITKIAEVGKDKFVVGT